MKRRKALKVTVGAVVLSALLFANMPTGNACKPSVCTPDRDAVVVALTGIIIPTTDTPGVKQTGMHRYIDLLRHDGPASGQERFAAGLRWLDDYAAKKKGRPFASLTAAEQAAIVAELDAEGTPDLEKDHQFFRMAKSMTSRIYYSTAIGYKKLNKGGRVPKTFDCEHCGHA